MQPREIHTFPSISPNRREFRKSYKFTLLWRMDGKVYQENISLHAPPRVDVIGSNISLFWVPLGCCHCKSFFHNNQVHSVKKLSTASEKIATLSCQLNPKHSNNILGWGSNGIALHTVTNIYTCQPQLMQCQIISGQYKQEDRNLMHKKAYHNKSRYPIPRRKVNQFRHL